MKSPFSGGPLRFLSFSGTGFMDAAKCWTFVFGVSALLCAGALGERVCAQDAVLTDAEVQSWFDSTLLDGAGNPLPVRPNCYVEELIDGPNTFQAMARRLGSVSGQGSYIYLLNWWIDDTLPLVGGDTNSTLLALLQKASDHQVQIRGMFWKQFAKSQNRKEVQDINNLENGSAILDNRTRWWGSHHQKILIIYDININGLVAFCGGIDFNRDRLYAYGVNGATQKGGPDHDVQCMWQGPAAWDLLQVFKNRWWDHPEVATLPTSPIDKKSLWGEIYPRNVGSTVNFAQHEWAQIGHTYPPPWPKSASWYDFAPQGEQTAKAIILHAIAKAKNYIYFEDQFMVSPEATTALQAALSNNPQLHLIILIPDWPLVSPQALLVQHRLQFLLPLGHIAPGRVHIYVRNTPDGTHTYVHSKVWIFDDEFAIIGSANCNARSWTYDSEVVSSVRDPGNGVNQRMPHRLRVELWGNTSMLPRTSWMIGAPRSRFGGTHLGAIT